MDGTEHPPPRVADRRKSYVLAIVDGALPGDLAIRLAGPGLVQDSSDAVPPSGFCAVDPTSRQCVVLLVAPHSFPAKLDRIQANIQARLAPTVDHDHDAAAEWLRNSFRDADDFHRLLKCTEPLEPFWVRAI